MMKVKPQWIAKWRTHLPTTIRLTKDLRAMSTRQKSTKTRRMTMASTTHPKETLMMTKQMLKVMQLKSASLRRRRWSQRLRCCPLLTEKRTWRVLTVVKLWAQSAAQALNMKKIALRAARLSVSIPLRSPN